MYFSITYDLYCIVFNINVYRFDKLWRPCSLKTVAYVSVRVATSFVTSDFCLHFPNGNPVYARLAGQMEINVNVSWSVQLHRDSVELRSDSSTPATSFSVVLYCEHYPYLLLPMKRSPIMFRQS